MLMKWFQRNEIALQHPVILKPLSASCRLGQLGLELEERIQTDRTANKRLPQLLTVSMWHTVAGKGTVDWRGNGSSASRSCQLRAPQAAPIAIDALALV